jgi:CubicO group peptidase (beta-lactamase class C family)
MRTRLIAVCAGLWLGAAVSLAGEAAKLNFAELESVVRAELKRTGVPGCAVAVGLGDEAIFAKGFGVANVETGEPVTADMLFRLGSTTKMFTAATLVSLVEAGKVKLDAPIGDYVQGLNPKLARLTSHQLLTHTAGLADETKMEGLHDESALAEGLRARGDDLCFTEPGKIWSPGENVSGEKIRRHHTLHQDRRKPAACGAESFAGGAWHHESEARTAQQPAAGHSG